MKCVDCVYHKAFPCKVGKVAEPTDWKDEMYAEAVQTEPKVKESPSLVKDLVKAFCEDGTWLERQGVYTLTLVEAKQRAVDIIESVVTDTEQTEWNCAACEHFRSDTEEATEKCIYCHEGSNFQCVKTKGEE